MFPTAASTGVPAGTTLTNSGAITVTVAGTVIDAKNITGGVWVRANNVTIQRSKITVGGGQSTVGVSIDAGRTGTRIVDTEIVAHNGFTGVIGGGGFTAQRVNIHGFENGIEIRGERLGARQLHRPRRLPLLGRDDPALRRGVRLVRRTGSSCVTTR